MPHNMVIQQGGLIFNLSGPDPTGRNASNSSQTKKKKNSLVLRTTYSILYADGRLECYSGDPFSVGSRHEGSKAAQVLYISQATGWATVGSVSDDPHQTDDEALSFSVRRKVAPSDKYNPQHLGLDVEVMGLPTNPIAKDPKDRKTFKDLLGLRSKRSKSIGGARNPNVPWINVLEGMPPPLPNRSSDGLSGDSYQVLQQNQPATPEDHQFSQMLPDPLIFSVDSVPARNNWIRSFGKVLAESPKDSSSAVYTTNPDLARRLNSSLTNSSPKSSPQLSLTLHSSPLFSPGSEIESKSHPLAYSSSIPCLKSRDHLPLFKSVHGSKATLPYLRDDPSLTSEYAISPTKMPTSASASLASPFSASERKIPTSHSDRISVDTSDQPSMRDESSDAVPAWIKSVRNANQKKLELELALTASSDPSSPDCGVQRSCTLTSTKSQSSQASIPMSSSLSAPHHRPSTASDKRGTFGHVYQRFTPNSPWRSISHSVAANLRLAGSHNELPDTDSAPSEGAAKVMDDSRSSKSSDRIRSHHAQSFDVSSLEVADVSNGKEKGLRFLNPRKKRMGSAFDKVGVTVSGLSQTALHDPSSMTHHNSSSRRPSHAHTISENTSPASVPHQLQPERDPFAGNCMDLYPANITPDLIACSNKGPERSADTYGSPVPQDPRLIARAPHSKKSFTEWLSATAAQATHDSQSSVLKSSTGSRNTSSYTVPIASHPRRRLMSEGRATSETSWSPPTALEYKSQSDHSTATTPSEDDHALSSVSCSSSSEAHAAHTNSTVPLYEHLDKTFPISKHLTRSDASHLKTTSESAADRWNIEHIIPPQQLIHKLANTIEVSQNLSTWPQPPSQSTNNANFLKSLNESRQLVTKQSRQKLKPPLSVLTSEVINGDAHLKPRLQGPETYRRPSATDAAFSKPIPQVTAPIASLPVPSRRRRPQNSPSKSHSNEPSSKTLANHDASPSPSWQVAPPDDSCDKNPTQWPSNVFREAFQADPTLSRLRAPVPHERSTSDLPIVVGDHTGELSDEVLSSGENDENASKDGAELDGSFIKPISGHHTNDYYANTLTPTNKSSFGQKLSLNSTTLVPDDYGLYRRGSQSTVRGL